MKLPPDATCLELGCGQGALARLLVERFQVQVTATDFDPAQVELARSRLHDLGEAVSFQVADARDLPFDDGRFDVVFSFGVLHHIAGGWRRVVSEVSRVLTSAGAFVFTDVYIARWFLQGFKVLFPRFDQLEYELLEEALAENGLDVMHQAWERRAAGLLRFGKTIARKNQTSP